MKENKKIERDGKICTRKRRIKAFKFKAFSKSKLKVTYLAFPIGFSSLKIPLNLSFHLYPKESKATKKDFWKKYPTEGQPSTR